MHFSLILKVFKRTLYSIFKLLSQYHVSSFTELSGSTSRKMKRIQSKGQILMEITVTYHAINHVSVKCLLSVVCSQMSLMRERKQEDLTGLNLKLRSMLRDPLRHDK